MKFIKIFTPVFLSLLLIFSYVSPIIAQSEDISTKVLRLHIRANSDSDADQALKLAVRDYVLDNSSIFNSCESIDDAIKTAQNNIDVIKDLAQTCIKANGYDYEAKVMVDYEYFDTRVYDKITLPAGYYNALRIDIGAAQGHNWWCIVFPSVCLSACGDDEMRKYLTDDEIDLIDNRKGYKVKFKTIEVYEKLKKLCM